MAIHTRCCCLVAIVFFGLGCGRKRDSFADHADMGYQAYKRGNLESAIKSFDEAIRINPKSADAYGYRGNAWRDQGDLDAALKDYTEAIRLDPESSLFYSARGNAWQSKGDLDAALADFTEAIRLAPENAVAHLSRGFAWQSRGDFKAALTDYAEAVRLEPENANAYKYRGFARQNLGDLDAAVADYTEAIRLDSENADAFNNLAWLKATCCDDKFRDGNLAVKLATKACELTEWQSGDCIDTLAAAHAEAEDWENAVRRQEQAIELSADGANKEAGKSRLERYKQQKPFRDQPIGAVP